MVKKCIKWLQKGGDEKFCCFMYIKI